jgi:hypothetical protein
VSQEPAMKKELETVVERILTYQDFEELVGETVSDHLRTQIEEAALRYRPVTAEEHDRSILDIVKVLEEQNLPKAGSDTLDRWEKGWSQNLEMFRKSDKADSVVPLYFGKNRIVRLRQGFVVPLTEAFEYRIYGLILDWLFDKYMRHAPSIYEFGCGTGYNLLRLRKVNSAARLWGLDWSASSQEIIKRMAASFDDAFLLSHPFDYYNPDRGFRLDPGSIVCTFASLEQVGEHFTDFVQYLIENRPSLCVHVEPIGELLNEGNLLDYLSLLYFRKRNYLTGFLDYLAGLERDGLIRILVARRTYTGSFFIEGHSVVVWQPV